MFYYVLIEIYQLNILGQIPICTTGLLAGVSPENIAYDNYNNPYIIIDDKRISLSIAITNKEELCIINRLQRPQQIKNDKIDIIGSVGFGFSSWPFKLPGDFSKFVIRNVKFADYLAIEYIHEIEQTVIMPIIIVEVDDKFGNYGMRIASIDRDNVTASVIAFLDSYL
mgnify:FL=1